MNHPHTGQGAPPRLRPTRAPSRPALGGAGRGERRRTVAADWPQPITAADRARIANDVDLLIAFLVAIATPMAEAGA